MNVPVHSAQIKFVSSVRCHAHLYLSILSTYIFPTSLYLSHCSLTISPSSVSIFFFRLPACLSHFSSSFFSLYVDFTLFLSSTVVPVLHALLIHSSVSPLISLSLLFPHLSLPALCRRWQRQLRRVRRHSLKHDVRGQVGPLLGRSGGARTTRRLSRLWQAQSWLHNGIRLARRAAVPGRGSWRGGQ